MVGFLTHTGSSHGGNGFEGMAFLLELFKGSGLPGPRDANHGLDLKAMARRFAEGDLWENRKAKEMGTSVRSLPGVHHPVFDGKAVNHDPKERFIAGFLKDRGQYNVFHAVYLELVHARHEVGASP